MQATEYTPLTVADYKLTPQTWKPAPFNFRGNPESKTFIEAFKRENNFENTGLALDYIVKSFQHTQQLTAAMQAKITELESLLAASPHVDSASATIVQPVQFQTKDEAIALLQEENENLKGALELAAQPIEKAVLAVFKEIADTMNIELPENANGEQVAEAMKNGIDARIAANHANGANSVDTWDVLEKLSIPNDFRKPEHNSPVDTIAYYIQEQDYAILKLVHDPLHLLEADNYKKLKEWDEKDFMPALRYLTDMPDLELTGAEKFMLMWDYVKYDPVSVIKKMILPDEVRAKLVDMQFPRREMMEQILKAKEVTNEPA